MLDRTDRNILAALEKNARVSNTDLARIVHISRPSIIKRINRFLEEGIIEKFTAVFSLKKIGRPVCSFIHISNIKLSVQEMLKVLDRDEIVEIYSVTGENNFIAKAAVSEIEEMENLLQDLMPYCKVVTSLVIIKHKVDRSLVK